MIWLRTAYFINEFDNDKLENIVECVYLINASGKIVQSFGRVLSVEVPGRDRLPPLGEDDGVVRGAVDLGRDDAADKLDGVVRDAVDLWRAPQCVRVLSVMVG